MRREIKKRRSSFCELLSDAESSTPQRESCGCRMCGTTTHLYPYALLLEGKSPGRSGKRQHSAGPDLQIIIRFRYRTSNLIFFSVRGK